MWKGERVKNGKLGNAQKVMVVSCFFRCPNMCLGTLKETMNYLSDCLRHGRDSNLSSHKYETGLAATHSVGVRVQTTFLVFKNINSIHDF